MTDMDTFTTIAREVNERQQWIDAIARRMDDQERRIRQIQAHAELVKGQFEDLERRVTELERGWAQ